MNPITSIMDLVTTVISRIFPDKSKQEELKAELLKMQMSGELSRLEQESNERLAQIKVNEEAAKSESIFIAGARPFILWVCAIALVWNYILQPICVFVLTATGHTLGTLPSLDSELVYLLFGLLGISGMRSWEKYKGIK